MSDLPPTIRRGDSGPVVAQWQAILGIKTSTPGFFRSLTEAKTFEWQAAHRLEPTGIVDQHCWELALAPPADGVSRPLFGPMPRLQREKVFGSFEWTDDDNDGWIKIPGAWDEENIRTELVEPLKGMPGCPSGLVTGHKLALPSIRGFFEDLEREKLLHLVRMFGGCFAPRRIRTLNGFSPNLSVHAWGAAFDINVQWNQLGREPAALGQEGSVIELLPIAYSRGFYWGGLFSSKDGMHFQLDNPAVLAP